MEFFGFEISRKRKGLEVLPAKSIEVTKDGSFFSSATSSGVNTLDFNFDLISSTDVELISTYRRISHYPEVATAIDEIINEIVVVEDDVSVVELNLDKCETISDNIKDKFFTEFTSILRILDFDREAYSIVRDWYVDSRIAYVKNVHENESDGIESLTQLDPKKLRRVKIVDDSTNGLLEVVEEFYVYIRNLNATSTDSMNTVVQMTANDYETFQRDVAYKIAPSSITYVDSGLVDRSSNLAYGHLHKAVRPANQLDLMESAMIIYNLSRAQEQRAIYVDTGNLPPPKAKEALNEVKSTLRRVMGYDTVRGTLVEGNRVMSMNEDYFMSRRGSTKSTEISPISSTANYNNVEGVHMFREKLYSSLNIPISRFKDSTSIFSQNSEITREELKFHRFITRLRNQFSRLFIDLLRTQLVLKGVITAEEFDDLEQNIKFRYNKDNIYSDLKELEILGLRIEAARNAEDFAGIYYSRDTIRKKCLNQSEEDIEEEDKLIKKEKSSYDPELIASLKDNIDDKERPEKSTTPIGSHGE